MSGLTHLLEACMNLSRSGKALCALYVALAVVLLLTTAATRAGQLSSAQA